MSGRTPIKETVLRVLEWLARWCAVGAGLLMTGVTLVTCGNLIGRNTIGVSMAGDFELTGVAAGAAVAMFLPWCQVRRGNIIVDFFTAKVSDRINAMLDRFGALLLGLVFAVLAWRTAVGGLNAWSSQSGTMMLGFPEWVVYVAMVPPFILTTIIALYQAATGAEYSDESHA